MRPSEHAAAAITVVIGVGNPLLGDDGLGLAALAHLEAHWDLPPDVQLVDGGTWGMNLLPVIEDAARVLLLDAIDVGAAPGTPVLIERSELPRYCATKISPHQVDLRDVLALAEVRGRLPEQTTAVGLQPGSLETAAELTHEVRDGVHGLADEAVRVLRSWGHVLRPRAVQPGRSAAGDRYCCR
jgi:hydrogenase maturation protease